MGFGGSIFQRLVRRWENMPARKKFDYDGRDFYEAIENLAGKDRDDKEIAMFLGSEIRAIMKRRYEAELERWKKGKDSLCKSKGKKVVRPKKPVEPDYDSVEDGLDDTVFNKMKNGNYEGWNDQENALRSMLISQALTHARAAYRIANKDVYNDMALGKRKVHTWTTMERQTVNREGKKYTETTKTTTEQELPPNMQALTLWRWNHDPEFREAMRDMKRMDVAVEDKSIDKIKINVVYNKKEDTELQNHKEEEKK